MPRSLTIYINGRWTTAKVIHAMTSAHGWRAPDPGRPNYFEQADGGRAWVVGADDDDQRWCKETHEFVPDAYVLFEPMLMKPGGVRRMLGTVFAIAQQSETLLFLYNGEDVLLRVEGGVAAVPVESHDWWAGEDVLDLADHPPL